MTPSGKPVIDWERIEGDYRAGVLSLREMVAIHGSSPAGILKRAKRDGWERDLGQKIKAKADALVNRQTVNNSVNTENTVSERQIVEANAESIASVRLAHRGDIRRARALSVALLAELESQTGNFPELVELGEMLRQPNDSGADRLNDIYRAVISLPERTKTMKALAETLKHLVGMEREAYGISSATQKAPGEGGESDLPTIPTDPIEAARIYQRVMQGG